MFEKCITRSELLRCALCKDAPCTAACGTLDPARILRSLWFDDEKIDQMSVNTGSRRGEAAAGNFLAGGRTSLANGAMRYSTGESLSVVLLGGGQHI